MNNQAVAEPSANRTFYSRSGALIVVVTPSRKVLDAQTQQVTTLPGKRAEFSTHGEGWGHFVTSDPEIIAHLEKHPDVLGPEAYNKAIIPPDKRAELLEAELGRARSEEARLIETNNRLLALLEEQKAMLEPRQINPKK